MKTLLLLFPFLAFGQDVSVDVTADVVPVAVDPLIGNMIADLFKGGHATLFAIACIINIIIAMMKSPGVSTWFSSPFMKKVKPWLAIGLGVLAGVLVAYTQKENLQGMVVMGLESGFAAIGIREMGRSTPILSALFEVIKVKTGYRK